MTCTPAVALAENRQAALEACAIKRSNPEQLPSQATDKKGASDSPVLPSPSTPPAAPVRSPTPRGEQQELQVCSLALSVLKVAA